MKNTRDNVVKYLEAAYRNLKFLVQFEKETPDGNQDWINRMEGEMLGYHEAIQCLTKPELFAELAAILLEREN